MLIGKDELSKRRRKLNFLLFVFQFLSHKSSPNKQSDFLVPHTSKNKKQQKKTFNSVANKEEDEEDLSNKYHKIFPVLVADVTSTLHLGQICYILPTFL